MSDNLLKKERDPFLDSLKFLLIALVVFGHALQYLYWEKNVLQNRLYLLIYSFHMPVFIFISGFLSKNLTRQKFIKSLPSLLTTFIIFQIILILPVLINETLSWAQILKKILKPIFVMWYIIALVFWRGFVSILPLKKLSPIVVIIGAFMISLLSGFYFLGDTAGRIATFLPYFIIGYYCTNSHLNKIRKINKGYAAIILCLAFLILYNGLPHPHFIDSLLGYVPYSTFESVRSGISLRLASYGFAIIIGVSIIALVPTIFAKWGNYTLYIYLLHAVILNLFYYNILSFFEIKSCVILHLISSVFFIWVILQLSKLKFIQYLVDPISHLQTKLKNE